MAVRYYLVASHYRSSLALLVDESDGSLPRIRGIEDAQAALGRLRRALGDEPLDAEGDLDTPSVQAFEAAMDADLNTPEALAVIFELARQINTERAVGGDTSLKRRTLVRLLDVLGLDAAAGSETNHQQSIEPFVDLLLETRRKLREVKQWALADELRDRLKSLGVVVEDRPGGESTWRLERTP
jgi:cysteinyl-tRNA synthetase